MSVEAETTRRGFLGAAAGLIGAVGMGRFVPLAKPSPAVVKAEDPITRAVRTPEGRTAIKRVLMDRIAMTQKIEKEWKISIHFTQDAKGNPGITYVGPEEGVRPEFERALMRLHAEGKWS